MKTKFRLLLALGAVATLAVGAVSFTACGEKVFNHDHQWSKYETTTPATCTEDGEKTRHCTMNKCLAVDTAVIEKTGHTWSLTKTIEPATCTQAGVGEYTCRRCSTVQTLDIKKLEHSYETIGTVDPRCEEDGHFYRKCKNCGDEVDDVIAKLGHRIEDPVIVYPTFERDGSESGYCFSCKQDVVIVMDQLQEGVAIEYQFDVLRNNGERIGVSGMRVVITDKNGNEVSSGDTNIYGPYKAMLNPIPGEKYYMNVTGLPDFITVEGPVEVAPEYPVGKCYLTVHMIPATEESPNAYVEGSVMQDFTMTFYDETTHTLSEILSQNKMVMLKFIGIKDELSLYELPALIEIYSKYKSMGFEIICIAPQGMGSNTEIAVGEFISQRNLPFPFVYASKSKSTDAYNLIKMFGLVGVPATVMIDHEGLVRLVWPTIMAVETDYGISCKEAFELFFQQFSTQDWRDMTTASAIENGLEISMLRGDYLPVFNED